MLETLSVRPRICDQIRSGPLGRWVDDFVDVLMTRGYATGTVRACRRMSSATLPRCTCSRPASTWRPSRCGSATSDSKPPINTARRTCNSRKTLCENSSRSVNERSGSRPTPRCWPSWRASDYDKQTTCWTPTATVSPTVTCHNAMLVILTETGLGSTARCCGRRRHRQANSVRVCSPTSRRVASLRPRSAGLTALTPAPRTLVQTGSCRRCSLIHPLHVVVDVPSRMTLFRATADTARCKQRRPGALGGNGAWYRPADPCVVDDRVRSSDFSADYCGFRCGIPGRTSEPEAALLSGTG